MKRFEAISYISIGVMVSAILLAAALCYFVNRDMENFRAWRSLHHCVAE